ncbi:MAG TPA: hypothetical protein VJH63_03170 [Candidatus Paceibacterota bacterium]
MKTASLTPSPTVSVIFNFLGGITILVCLVALVVAIIWSTLMNIVRKPRFITQSEQEATYDLYEEAVRDLHEEEGNGILWKAGILICYICERIAMWWEKKKMGW